MKPSGGFIVIPILIIFIIIGITSYFLYFKSNSSDNIVVPPYTDRAISVSKTENNEGNTNSNLIQQTIIPDSDWLTQVDDMLGFAFETPRSWKVIRGYGSDNSGYDIYGPDNDLLVLIGVYSEERIGVSKSLEEILNERIKDSYSDEGLQNINIRKIKNDNHVGYVATGKRPYFNFKNDNAWDESDFVTYDFQEKVYVRSDKKVVVLQSFVLPKSHHAENAARIINSFKL